MIDRPHIFFIIISTIYIYGRFLCMSYNNIIGYEVPIFNCTLGVCVRVAQLLGDTINTFMQFNIYDALRGCLDQTPFDSCVYGHCGSAIVQLHGHSWAYITDNETITRETFTISH